MQIERALEIIALSVLVSWLGACTSTHGAADSSTLEPDASERADAASAHDAAGKGDVNSDGRSCAQLAQSAAQEIEKAVELADTTCKVDSDCVRVPKASVCTDSCSDAIVSASGKKHIETALTFVKKGVCTEFIGNGCQVLALPCEPSGSMQIPVCASGKCQALSQDAAICPNGCRPNGQGVCEGEASCTRCPAHPDQPRPASCTHVDQSCFYAPSCGGYECYCTAGDADAPTWFCSARAC